MKIKLLGTMLLMVFAGSSWAQQPAMQYFRYNDQRGINVFETKKDDSTKFDGFKFRIGAGFTQGYQSFNHENSTRVLLPDAVTKTTTVGTAPNTVKVSETITTNYIQLANGNYISRTDFTGDPVTGIGSANEIPGSYFVKSESWRTYVYTPDPAAPNTQRIITNSNELYEMSGGFPLAQANLNFDVQLADGVRLHLASYMSSHHHNEFWVKGGYLQVDKVGFMNNEFMNKLWTNLTLKVGHMEINYGDAHFRRSDGGNTILNPFMENYIMDPFTTEIGAELYWQRNNVTAMFGYTDGEIQGNVTKPGERSPNFYGKLAYDNQLTNDIRVRLSGSLLNTSSSIRNTLYGGDRTGSNYQFVMDPLTASTTGNFASGRFNPGLTDNLTAWVINPFVKFKGIELFGTYEVATGNTAVENGELQYSDPSNNDGTAKTEFSKLDDRKATQLAVDLLYRFGKGEKFYVGARYNKVDSEIALGQATNTASYINQGTRFDVSIDRTSIAAGWFITKNVLFKAEYVMQNYNDFPEFFKNTSTGTGYWDSSMFANGRFDGLVIQGVISF